MSTLIHAPYPAEKVTIVLPSAQFEDTRQPEHDVTVQRSMLGRVVTYVRSTPRRALVLPLQLSRMKSLELDAFVRIYYRAEWRIVLYDGSQWRVRMSSEPSQRITSGRTGDSQGGELVEWTLNLKGFKL